MWQAIQNRLVDNWQLFYKRASVWLAAVYSTISTIVLANQSTYFTLINYLPKGPLRVIALAVFWLSLLLIPIVTVLWKQNSISGCPQKPPNG